MDWETTISTYHLVIALLYCYSGCHKNHIFPCENDHFFHPKNQKFIFFNSISEGCRIWNFVASIIRDINNMGLDLWIHKSGHDSLIRVMEL
jgi:hypothetical protein